MEALSAIYLAPGLERVRRRFGALPRLNVSWVRIEFVFLTGALIMAG